MNWRQLIDAAKELAGVASGAPAGPGRPRQIRLRRALSTAYYAMFHALCRSNAETLIGSAQAMQGAESWVWAYRALDHRPAKNKMAEYRPNGQIHQDIASFSQVFSNLQEHRHDADYDPLKVYTRYEVDTLIDQAEAAIETFEAVPAHDRRDLAAYLLLARNR